MFRPISRKFAIPVLFFAAFLGTKFGENFNPILSWSTAVVVDDAYLEAWRNYCLILGVIVGISVAFAGASLRAGIRSLFWTLVVWGTLYSIWHQSAEPDFMQYVFFATLEFLAPYLATALPVVGLVHIGARALARRIGAGNT